MDRSALVPCDVLYSCDLEMLLEVLKHPALSELLIVGYFFFSWRAWIDVESSSLELSEVNISVLFAWCSCDVKTCQFKPLLYSTCCERKSRCIVLWQLKNTWNVMTKTAQCEMSRNEKVKYVNENLHIYAIEVKFEVILALAILLEWTDR